MLNKKLISIIVAFTGLTVLIIVSVINLDRENTASSQADAEEVTEETNFKGLSYFKSENKEKKLKLIADELTIINSKDLKFKSPNGAFYKGDKVLKFSSVKGNFLAKNEILNLSGAVDIATSNGSTHKADIIKYFGKKNKFVATGNTESVINSHKEQGVFKVKSAHMSSKVLKKEVSFEGDVKAILVRNRSYEGTVRLKAQKMLLKQLESHVFLEGEVSVSRNRYNLEANKADIFLENFNKTLKYYVLYDDIKLEEKITLDDGTSIKRKAFSEKLEGYMREGKIVLSGAPRVEQDNDLIKGYQITLRENVELVEVDDSQTSFKIKRNNE